MKKEKTKLEVIGGELIIIAKCIKYFKKRGKNHITCSLQQEYIPILESCGYKISRNKDGDMELSWNE